MCEDWIQVSVPGNYDTVEIVYKTFIAPDAVATLLYAFWLIDYYQGDARWFGGAGLSRSTQIISVSVDPQYVEGQASPPQESFGPTVGYDGSPPGSDVTRCNHCAGPYGDWCLVTGATPFCSLVAAPGVYGNVLTIEPDRVSPTEIQVKFDLVGYLPCEAHDPTVPAIDAHFTIHFRQLCLNGPLQPMQFRLFGIHDGFPWHELEINEIRVHEHDPCCSVEGPASLFGSGEWNYKTKDATDVCHAPLTGIPLQQWQPVPGQNP